MGVKRKIIFGIKKEWKFKFWKIKVVLKINFRIDVVEVLKRIVFYVLGDVFLEEFKNVWVCSLEKKYVNWVSRLFDLNFFGLFGNEMFWYMML